MDDIEESAKSRISRVQKSIVEAFNVFDLDGSGTVDVREVATIVRSLGCCPTEVKYIVHANVH